MGLLGQAIALRAGTNYEALVVDRICGPLKMDGTRITLTPELQARLATGHNAAGQAVKNWDFQALAGAGALRSTANDLLRIRGGSNLGLMPSSLTPLMEKTHEVRRADVEPDHDIASWAGIPGANTRRNLSGTTAAPAVTAPSSGLRNKRGPPGRGGAGQFGGCH